MVERLRVVSSDEDVLPLCADRSREESEWTRLVILEPAVVNRLEPSAVEPSRAEPRVLVETAPAGCPVAPDSAAAAGIGVAAEAAAPAGEAVAAAGANAGAFGGLPQTSQ